MTTISIHYSTRTIVPITLPSNLKSLNKKSYGGLTRRCWSEGMSILLRYIASRVNWLTTTAPGQHSQLTGGNGWDWPDLTNEDTLLRITTEGMATPGLSPVPVYSAHEAWASLTSDEVPGANCPCNS
jgi:hypothetical protein